MKSKFGYDNRLYEDIRNIVQFKKSKHQFFGIEIDGKMYAYNDPDKIIVLSLYLTNKYRECNYNLPKCISICKVALRTSGHYENYKIALKKIADKYEKTYHKAISLQTIEDNFYVPLLVHKTIRGAKAEDYYINKCISEGNPADHASEHFDRHLHTDVLVFEGDSLKIIQIKSADWRKRNKDSTERNKNIEGMKEACKLVSGNKYGFVYYDYNQKTKEYKFTEELYDYDGGNN